MKKWPDETTRALVARHVLDADFTRDQRASLCLPIGGRHSEFGRVVFTKDVDGLPPYLDPAKAISSDHVMRAAKKAGVEADRVDEMVRSLSGYLGWDLTTGAGA